MWFLSAFFGKDLSQIKIDRPIFIVGLPGSGASLVYDLLCAHDQAAHIDKTQDFPLKRIGKVRKNIRKILHEFGAEPGERGTRHRFVFKCSVFQTDLKALSEAFPDAYFVHVMREGRHAAIQAVRNELSNYAEVGYNDFLADPTGEILWLMNRVALPRPAPENAQFWELLSGYLPPAVYQARPSADTHALPSPARQNDRDIDRGAPLAP
jgi:hypothetical protein